MVELPPDVAVFAVVRDMTGRWAVLAPVNHHPGGGVGVRCVAAISARDCRFSFRPMLKRASVVRGTRDRRRLPVARRQPDSFDSGVTGGSVSVLRPAGGGGVTGGSVSVLPPAGCDGRHD
jgi:hypothetical protein